MELSIPADENLLATDEVEAQETIYTVYEASSKLMEEDDYVNTTKRVIVSAILNEGEEIVPNILLASFIGVDSLARKYYRYGKQKYIRGLPFATFIGETINNQQITLPYIASETGNTNVIVTSEGVPPQIFWNIYWGYVCLENEFENADGEGHNWSVSMEEVLIPTYGYVPNKIIITVIDGVAYITIEDDPYETLYGPISQYWVNEANLGDRVLFSSYTSTQTEGLEKHWWHNLTRYPEKYPQLTYEFRPLPGNDFLPIALLLENYRPFNANENDDTYITTKKLLDKMNMDADKLYEDLLAADAQGAEKTDVFIHFAIDVHDNLPGPTHYVYNFCEYLHRNMQGSTAPYQALTVEERGTEVSSFNTYLEWDYISKVYHDENRYPVGNANKLITWDPVAQRMTVIVGKQERENRYTEYTIHNFKTFMAVFHLQSGQGWQRKDVPTQIKWMPINVDVLSSLSPQQQEELIQASIYGTVLLVHEQDVPWYRDTWFKVIVVVITVALVVFAAPLAAAAGGWLVGALGAGILSSVLTLAIKFAIGFIISMSVSFLELGIEGQIVVFVITAALSFGLSNLTSRAAASAALAKSAAGWMTAEGLLKAVSYAAKLVKIGIQYYQERAYQDRLDENEDLLQSYEEEQEALDALYHSLDSDSVLSPLDVVRRGVDYLGAEGPQSFYARALDNDPGEKAFYVLDRFVQIALTLPEAGTYNPLEVQLESMHDGRL